MNSRRSFLRQLAILTSGMMVSWDAMTAGFPGQKDRWGKILPLRKLGSTGREVTMLGVGGYHVGWTTEKDARIQNGVLKLAEEALKEGKAKHIGFTGHQSPYAHLRMLEQAGNSGLFSTLQMPINVVDAASEHSFVHKVIPKAVEAGLGLLAMKTLADGRFFNKKKVLNDTVWESEKPVVPDQLSIREALFFAWSMPVSVLITGAENAKLLKEKIKLAKQFTQLTEANRLALADRLTGIAADGEVEYYKKI